MKDKLCTKLIILLLLLIPLNALATNPCKAAKELWRDRIKFDIEMRKKRIELRKERIAIRQRDNQIEEKIIAVQEKLLSIKDNSQKEDLWAEYDRLNNERSLLAKKKHESYQKYMTTSYNRGIGKIEKNIKIWKKRYQCVVNDELNGKLENLLSKLQNSGKLNKNEAIEFKHLVDKRKTELSNLEKGYKSHQELIKNELNGIISLKEQHLKYDAKLVEVDNEQERLYEQIYESFNKWGEELRDYADRLTATSEKLLTLSYECE